MRIGMGVGISDSANKIGGRAVPWADNVYAATINDADNSGGEYGVYFDGPPLADVIGSNPSEFSVSFWIKMGSRGWNITHPPIIGSTTAFDSPSGGFGIHAPGNNWKRFWVNDIYDDFLCWKDTYPPNWNHFAFSWNAGSAKYWRNGIAWGNTLDTSNSPSFNDDTKTDWYTKAGDGDHSTVDTSGTQNLRIAMYGNTNLPTGYASKPGFFNGYLDEVSIYTKELSQTDVDYIFNGSLESGRAGNVTISDLLGEGAPTGLAGWWRFGDVDGDDDTLGTGVLKDASGNGHDMDIVDASSGSGFLDFQDSDTPET